MNLIEKRKGQLKFISILILLFGVVLATSGVVLLLNSGIGSDLDIMKLVFGIVLVVFGITGLAMGVFFTIMANSIKATQGSIAENNLGKGTVNMLKCENCGTEVEAGQTICAKCEENLKP